MTFVLDFIVNNQMTIWRCEDHICNLIPPDLPWKSVSNFIKFISTVKMSLHRNAATLFLRSFSGWRILMSIVCQINSLFVILIHVLKKNYIKTTSKSLQCKWNCFICDRKMHFCQLWFFYNDQYWTWQLHTVHPFLIFKGVLKPGADKPIYITDDF